MTTYLVRHASAGSRDDADPHDGERELDEVGRAQADKLASWLRHEPIERIVTSPLRRCVQSTFAEALQQHFPHFRRCNQDDLGDRRRVEQLAYETLEQGLSVCIDRTNFNAA